MALSTAEAEYMALASAAQEAIWLQHLVSDLGNKPVDPMVLYEDNQSAICMAKNHYIQEQVEWERLYLSTVRLMI